MKHDGQNHRRLSLGAAVCLGLVFTAWAAPILPTRPGPQLSDEHLCVRGIKKVSIEILGMPESLDNEIARRRMTRHFGRALMKYGFEVDEKVTTPRLRLQYWTATDLDDPDSVALTTLIGVNQKVTVHRLEQALVLPCASFVQTAICRRADLQEMMIQEVGRATAVLGKVVSDVSASGDTR